MNSTDTGRSVTCSGVVMSVNGTRTSPAIGITANAVIAGIATTNGASMKTSLSAAVGVKSSLNISFMPSARDCSSPNGPFMFGPCRCCMKATTRRSYQMVNKVSTSSSTNANSALSTHDPPDVVEEDLEIERTHAVTSSASAAAGEIDRAMRHHIPSSRGQMPRHLDAAGPARHPDHAVGHVLLDHHRQRQRPPVVRDHHMLRQARPRRPSPG